MGLPEANGEVGIMSSLGREVGAPMIAALLLGFAGAASAAQPYKLANEGEIRHDWAFADGVKLAVPGYPAAFTESGDNVCVALGYAINSDGTTSDFSVLKTWSSNIVADGVEPAKGYWDAFIQSGANSVARWKFKPRNPEAKPRPTYTVATISFTNKLISDVAAIRNECAIGDLTAFLQHQRESNFAVSAVYQMMQIAEQEAIQRRMEAAFRDLNRSRPQAQPQPQPQIQPQQIQFQPQLVSQFKTT